MSPWLCPVKAFARWIELNKKNNVPMSGYMFRRKVNLKYNTDGRYGMVSGIGSVLCFVPKLMIS